VICLFRRKHFSELSRNQSEQRSLIYATVITSNKCPNLWVCGLVCIIYTHKMSSYIHTYTCHTKISSTLYDNYLRMPVSTCNLNYNTFSVSFITQDVFESVFNLNTPTIKLAFVSTLVDVRPSAELQSSGNNQTKRQTSGVCILYLYIVPSQPQQSTSFFPHVTCVYACFDY
jgi:hypothetical protein